MSGSSFTDLGTYVETFTVERSDLGALIDALKRRGYAVIAPSPHDGAIDCREITTADELPLGWTDEQANAHYRLIRREDDAVFGHAVGPTSWKQHLFPPVHTLFTRNRTPENPVLPAPERRNSNPAGRKLAFLGVRPCELAALRIQDAIFLGGAYNDPLYAERRAELMVIAVNCTHPGGTCFCASMGTGPRAQGGYDIAMTEVLTSRRHYFYVEVGTDRGAGILKNVPHANARAEDMKEAREVCEQALHHMGRVLNTDGLKEILSGNSEHPRWDRIGSRCLNCANCTMVCPTCFCASIDDVTDLSGAEASRVRTWDSCFTLGFSYIHGGSVRASAKARYRQWLTHKFSSWVDQFGTFGCVGCGRCITWCPVGIDITEEAGAIRESQRADLQTQS